MNHDDNVGNKLQFEILGEDEEKSRKMIILTGFLAYF